MLNRKQLALYLLMCLLGGTLKRETFVGMELNLICWSLWLLQNCAPKSCGVHHFLGGRLIPKSVVDKFKLNLPLYPGTSMCVRIGNLLETNISRQQENSAATESPEVEENSIDQFQKWFSDALSAGVKEPHCMVLSTTSKEARPSSRMISLEGATKYGFVWYTNYRRRKACEISENPHVSLLLLGPCEAPG